MSLKEKCSNPMTALVIFLVITIVALLTAFIILKTTDPHITVSSPAALVATVTQGPRITVEKVTPLSNPSTISKTSKNEVCLSPECITLSHQLLNFRDTSVDPCDDFFKYSCGRFVEQSTQRGLFAKKNKIVEGLIQEFLVKTKKTDSKSEQVMLDLYRTCQNFKDIEKTAKLEELAYRDLLAEIHEMGGWSMMKDGVWKDLDLTELLSKIAQLNLPRTHLNMGLFSFFFTFTRKIGLIENGQNLIDTEVMEKGFEDFMKVSGIKFDKKGYREEMDKVLAFEKELVKLHERVDRNESLPFTELQKNIHSIDFDKLLNSLRNPKKPNLEKIKERVIVDDLEIFEDGKLDALLNSTPKEVIANFLIMTFFQPSIRKIKLLSDFSFPCHKLIIEFLPHASLRVFVRNYFHKENIQSVSNLVEDMRNGFLEMIHDSTWIQNEFERRILEKLEKMEKVIGYPEEMEKTGALDATFEDINITSNSSGHQFFSQIDKHGTHQMMDYITSESPLGPQSSALAVNAFYMQNLNSLTVLVPIMDDPLYDFTFPKYAQIASMGFTIGHEIGHGFDPNGIELSSDGEYDKLAEDKDLEEYWKRMECYINQYDNYDDPDFGRNLNGTKTLKEMIADDIGADVAWRAFKKSDPENQQKLVGFEDYSIDKLYFQLNALKSCSARSRLLLDFQLESVHPTNSFRVNGVYSNMKQFAETFNCPIGSPMNPEKKCELF